MANAVALVVVEKDDPFFIFGFFIRATSGTGHGRPGVLNGKGNVHEVLRASEPLRRRGR